MAKKIDLTKGASVNLKKEDGSDLTKIHVGLGWDPAGGGGLMGFLGGATEIDLDASLIYFDKNGNKVDTIWYGQLKSRCLSAVHSGDNRTGAGDGDDEVIQIDLSAVPANVNKIAVTINSYTNQKFSQVKNAYCRVLDASASSNPSTMPEMTKFTLSEQKNQTGVVIAKIERGYMGWKFTAVGEFKDGKTVSDMINFAATL